MVVAGVLSLHLRRALQSQGALIARCPGPFILLPVALTCALGYFLVGVVKFSGQDDNALELYVPKQGLSKTGRESIQQHFGDTDQSEFDPINGVSFAIVLKQVNGGDILNGEFISEYLWLRQKLESMRVTHDNRTFDYEQLCHRNRLNPESCMPDFIQLVTRRGIEGYRDIRLMSYPKTQWRHPGNGVPFDLVVPLGGVNMSSQELIVSARAVLMTFTFAFVHYDAAQQWETQLQLALAQWKSHRIALSLFTMNQFQKDLSSMASYLHDLMPALLLVIIVFCVLSCCVADWVHSKPLLAIAGVVCTLLAIVCGFGCCVLLAVPTVDIVYVSPFLMLSVGVDDMFLMLAAWRRTSIHWTVEQRMQHTFGEAAVSVTITSVTDALSFAIGAFTVFPAVRYFCIYTAISLVFTYAFQITLFGGCLALSGYREAQNRHCVAMIKLKTSDQQDIADRSLCYRVLCTGGDGRLTEDIYAGVASTLDGHTAPTANQKRGCLPIKPHDNIFNLFFQRYYAPLLRHDSVKLLAAVSYLLYLLMAVYGATTVRIGMNYAELLPDGSPTSLYLHDFGEYFAHHLSAPLEVLLPTVDLSRASEQHAVVNIIREFEDGVFTASADYWLFAFASFYAANRGTSADFYLLLNEFLQVPAYAKYAAHVKFDPLHRRITSRALVDTRNIAFGQERIFLSAVKEILSQSQMENVTAYHSTFQLAEQQSVVLPAMIQTVGAATLAMLVVAALLIPKAACSVCLAASIISTNFGVLGAMSLWGVRIDIISMITVLMSVGMSVDFVAHVSYFYVQALQMDMPLSKAQRALTYLGLPIMQGAMSTICGMLVLLAIRAYMVRAFVKTLLLVIVFGLYHGLLLLPIVLSLFIKDNSAHKKAPTQVLASGDSVFNDTIKRSPKSNSTGETAALGSSSTDTSEPRVHQQQQQHDTAVVVVAQPLPTAAAAGTAKRDSVSTNILDQLSCELPPDMMETTGNEASTTGRPSMNWLLANRLMPNRKAGASSSAAGSASARVPVIKQALPVRQITRQAKVMHWLTAHPDQEPSPPANAWGTQQPQQQQSQRF